MVKAIRIPEPVGTFDRREAAEAQRRYCTGRNIPLFAPEYGTCPYCYEDIYAKGRYSVEYAGSHIITDCPVCHRTYCD